MVGTPRGFSRSVLEALLKRGSKVVLTCSNEMVAGEEQKRLSSLYGSNQIIFTPSNHTNERQLESVFIRALDTVSGVERTGVRVCNVYHPAVDFTDHSCRSAQITDDQHSPYGGGDMDKYSCYLREYTGYM